MVEIDEESDMFKKFSTQSTLDGTIDYNLSIHSLLPTLQTKKTINPRHKEEKEDLKR